jgi:hypothetical protein
MISEPEHVQHPDGRMVSRVHLQAPAVSLTVQRAAEVVLPAATKRAGHPVSFDGGEEETYICGELGAVEIGVSVKALPTPSLEACNVFPRARPATVLGGTSLMVVR